MIKFLLAGRRAAGTTRRSALDHLRDIHGKLVVCPPPDAGAMPIDYVQNHVIDGAYPASGAHALERDLVTELWFESVDHMRAATATPYYLAHLRPDEPRFVDDATVARMMVRPSKLMDGGREEARFKAFLFVGRAHPDDARWDGARRSAASAFLASPGIVAAVENVVLPPLMGDAPFVDLIFEGWFATPGAAAAVAAQRDGLIAAFGRDVAAPARSFALVAEQYDRRRLQAWHRCLRRPSA